MHDWLAFACVSLLTSYSYQKMQPVYTRDEVVAAIARRVPQLYTGDLRRIETDGPVSCTS